MSNSLSPGEHTEFYDRRWKKDAEKDRLNGFQLARMAAVLDALAFLDFEFKLHRQPPLAICDLGCGRGWMASQLSAVGAVTGVDFSPEGLRLAGQQWPHIRFICSDIATFEAEQKFDLIVSSEVIEHFPRDQKHRLVESIVRNIMPGGFIIITTPNARAKWAWERAGQLTQPVEDWMSLSELRDLFAGEFQLLDHKTFFPSYTYLGVHRIFSAPKVLRFLRRTRLLPAYQGLQTALGVGLHQILVARKR